MLTFQWTSDVDRTEGDDTSYQDSWKMFNDMLHLQSGFLSRLKTCANALGFF